MPDLELARQMRIARLSIPGIMPVLATAWSCGREPTAGGTASVRERWHQSQPGYGSARPAVAGDIAYFGTGDGYVVARDARTGGARWSTRVTAGPVEGANFVVRGGVVAVADVRSTVALDASTGRLLWRYEAPPDTGLGASGLPGQVVASHLDIDEQAVYVPAWGASVSAVDLHTGAARWVWQPGRAPTDTSATGRLFRSGSMGVRVSGDTVFATAWHSTNENGGRSEVWLLALNRATGRELWRAVLPGDGGITRGAPALVGRLAVIFTQSTRVFAVDRATGRVAWEFQAPVPADGRRLTPTAQAELYGDAVYVDGGDSHIYALDARDGRVRWRGEIQAQATRDLLVTERRVFVPVSGYLYAFDRATGRRMAELRQPRTTDALSFFASAAAFSDGGIYVTLNGAAWSFDEP